MQRNSRTVLIAVAGLALMTGMGCERLKSMGGGGGAMTTLNAQPEDVVDAAARTVEDHRGLVLISERSNELGGMVIARTVEDNPFRIQVNRQSRGISRISIEAADQGLAYDVMEEIRSGVGGGGGEGMRDRNGGDREREMERDRDRNEDDDDYEDGNEPELR